MGHWLDGLFDSGGVSIEWNGTPLPDEDILAFGEQFDVSNQGGEPGRNIVTIRFVGMVGDVTGDTDENLVTTISGDEDTNIVSMFAVALQWDADVAATEPALTIGGDGAIELWNDAKRSIAASATGPVLGHTTAVTQIAGGLRVTRRTINTTPVVLDATATQVFLLIDASVERSVKLPPPTDGRVFFFVLVGGTSDITIQRNASELINGVASNYVPADNSRGWIISDGTDWYTFVGLQ